MHELEKIFHSTYRFTNGGTLEQYGNGSFLHRTDGPALIEKDPRGRILRAEEWVNGKRVSQEDQKPTPG